MNFKENQCYLLNILVFGSIKQNVSSAENHIYSFITLTLSPTLPALGLPPPNHIPNTRYKTVIFLILTDLNAIDPFAYVTGRH